LVWSQELSILKEELEPGEMIHINPGVNKEFKLGVILNVSKLK